MNTKSVGSIIEPIVWIVFAALAYYFSFNFEKEIEIYRYGASGWPRAIIVLMLITAVFLFIKRGTHSGFHPEDKTEATIHPDSPGIAEKPNERNIAYYLKVGTTLILPIIYAGLMEKIGFYTLTPFFICGFLLLAGERRIKVLIAMSLGVYALFVFIFGKLLYINLPIGTMRPFYDFSNWLLVFIR